MQNWGPVTNRFVKVNEFPVRVPAMFSMVPFRAEHPAATRLEVAPEPEKEFPT